MDDSTIIHPRLPGRDRNLALNLLFVSGFTFEVKKSERHPLDSARTAKDTSRAMPLNSDKALYIHCKATKGKNDQYCLLLTNQEEKAKNLRSLFAPTGDGSSHLKKGRNPTHSLLLFDQE